MGTIESLLRTIEPLSRSWRELGYKIKNKLKLTFFMKIGRKFKFGMVNLKMIIPETSDKRVGTCNNSYQQPLLRVEVPNDRFQRPLMRVKVVACTNGLYAPEERC